MENTLVARNYKFESKELAKATTAIVKATENVGKNLLKIAATMEEVEARALYADDFRSITEYGEKVFGYKKSAVNNMVRVGAEYLDPETGKSVLALEDGRDFTFSQLTRMLPLPSAEVAAELVEAETITPNMTTREIEAAVKAYNHKDDSTEETEAEVVEGEAEVVESEVEELDEIASNFLSAKMALDRLAELLDGTTANGYVPAEELRNIKARIEGIEKALN